MSKLLNYISILAVSANFVVAAYADTPASPEKEQQMTANAPTDIAAQLDGKEYTVADIDNEIKQKPNFAIYLKAAENNPRMLTDLRRRVASMIIDREILLQAAQKSPAVVPAEVEKSVDGVIQSYGGREKIEELLKSIGTTYDTFKIEIAKDFAINQYIEKVVMKDSSVTDDELLKTFKANPDRYATKETVKAKHILIKADKNAPEAEVKAAEAEINKWYQEAIKPNADFSAIAKEHSQCPSAAQGGDLGAFSRGMMVPEFETVAFEAKPMEVSKPFRTQFGFHIVQVYEHDQAKSPDFAAAKEQVAKDMQLHKREALVQQALQELKKQHQVAIKI